ncbi:MAG: FGGY family carbohydrate kinase [Eubacteriales bacterium]|nr:FGGY family carbohydrate kinase [Eubacteriales bacterium]
MPHLIAYDLGTGGIKATLHDEALRIIESAFVEYRTHCPSPQRHEQRPEDWWAAVCASTKKLLASSGVPATDVAGAALSGQSLVAIPLDAENAPLLEQVPIWSDTRAQEESKAFFGRVSEAEWYLATGNGFPAPCYSLFKIMWLKKHQPEIFRRTRHFVGSKDYINLKLTGVLRTDRSYASGTGAYHLKREEMWQPCLDAAGIDASLFPERVPSHAIIGRVNGKAARETGLMEGTPVACGAVDNACMALGAVGVQEGGVYVSLGSSSWIPVNSREPVLDPVHKSYVFAHAQEGLYTSAFSIFAGGSSFKWVKETLLSEIADRPDAYDRMGDMASQSPLGAAGVLFNPSLAGGTSQDESMHIRGAFLNLSLGSRREDLIRAAMEGIALNLRSSLLYLKAHTPLSDPILFCGGGAKSPFWMQMFADVFGMNVITTNIEQDAASLGAAAIAARAVGLLEDYQGIPALHETRRAFSWDRDRHAAYLRLHEVFTHASGLLASFGEELHKFRLDRWGDAQE